MGTRKLRARSLGAALLAGLAALALVPAAWADPPQARYTASIAPQSAEAGSTATYTLTVTNVTPSSERDERAPARAGAAEGGPRIGSVNVAIPAGFTGVSVASVKTFKRSGVQVSKGWTGKVEGGLLELRSRRGEKNRLRFGQSVRVEITATAPCDAAAGVWTTAARTTHLFTGTAFALSGSQPATPVGGSCAVQLAFVQQPASTPVGDPIAPDVTVEIEDGAGQRVTTDSTTQVTLAIDTDAGPGGTLGGVLTRTAVNGLATFSGLSIDVAGEGYTLKATSSPALAPATSEPFDVTLAQRTVEATPGEPLSSPPQCDAEGDQTGGIPSCVGIDLPHGANGTILLATNAPPPGFTTANAVLGDFKDGEGQPLYGPTDPAFIELEIDCTALPGGCGGLERAVLGEAVIGDYLPFRDPELVFDEPRTGFRLQIQLTDGGPLEDVPVCEEPEDEAFDTTPDGDETIPDQGLFEGGGACMAASHFDDEGDLHLFVAFFGDPRLYGH
jgi:hypothetical protein